MKMLLSVKTDIGGIEHQQKVWEGLFALEKWGVERAFDGVAMGLNSPCCVE